MARFSVMQEDDSEGPSSPRPKRQRATRRQEPKWLEEDEEIVEEAEYEEEDEDEEEAVSEEQEVEDEDEEEEEEEEEEETEDAGQASNAAIKGSGRDSNVNDSIFITLTDPDVLDCPICLEPLTIPVFQCENGHVACSCCCSKIRNKCPTCSLPIGYNRCRAIEKVLESIKMLCRNIKCKEMVSYSNKHHHEETCIYAPCSCPLPNCDFVGYSKCLYLHFRNKHSNSATPFCFDKMFSVCLQMNQNYLILQEQKENTIFILNHAADRLGNVVNIDCIGPSSSKKGFSYELMAINGGSSVRLQYFIESIPRWSVHIPQKAFLLVPNGFVGCEQLKLQICILNQDSTVCYRSTKY